MKTEIYYFTGTGNSFAAARDIAEKIKGKLISIPSMMSKERIKTDADVIGIVFPIYYSVNDGIPFIIKRFVKKLDGISSKYIFAVATCGASFGIAIGNIKKIIRLQGAKLSAGFTVQMPSNVMSVPLGKQQKVINNWGKKLEVISEYINSREKGKFENISPVIKLIFAPLAMLIKPIMKGMIKKLSNSKNLAFEELIYLSDKSYYYDANCNGCGICEKVCPVNNINMTNDRPEWRHKCETCLACFHWCPEEAIHGGIAPKMKKYHHPDVTIDDIIHQAVIIAG